MEERGSDDQRTGRMDWRELGRGGWEKGEGGKEKDGQRDMVEGRGWEGGSEWEGEVI